MAAFHYISYTTLNGTLTFSAKGAWVSQQAAMIEREISIAKAEALTEKGAENSAHILLDVAGISRLDTYGAWLLEELQRDCARLGYKLNISGLTEDNLALTSLMKKLNKKQPAALGQDFFSRSISNSQQALKAFGLDLVSFAHMLGAISYAFFNVLKRPKNFRLTSTVHQLDKVGWQAIPIIILITLLVGGIIAQQGFFHFRKLGAELYVVDMVGILVLREVSILLVAIMVAGRSGSAYTAEIGSMKMREEIDALRTMGFNPIEVLILPRVLMLIVAVPILTFLGSLAALYGGGLAAWLYGGMSPEIFTQRLKEAISLTHFQVGMIKAPFMGLVIGVVATAEGLKVKGSAESLGQHTTRSVVKAIFMVIILDGLFAIFFTSIGM